MATATVVTAQEIYAVITYQEQIERERELSEQEFKQYGHADEPILRAAAGSARRPTPD